MRRIKTKLPWLIGLLLIVAAIAFGFWPETIEVDIASVTTGAIQLTVDDDGETRIREKYVVSAPVAGKLLRVQLHAGDPVTKETTELARIEPGAPDLMDARMIAEAQARLRAAEANVERSRLILKQSQEAMELASHRFERVQDLLPRKAVSQSEFDEAEHQLHISQAEVHSAEFGVSVAAFELEQAQAVVARYDESASDFDEAFRLVSPIDGLVLNIFQEDSGVVPAGLAILELGDPRDLEIVIDVLSTDAVNINAGQPVIIEHWGGKSPLEARVRRIEPSAFLKVSALGVEEKRVNVIADFLHPELLPAHLGDGFRVEARIVVESTDPETLKVPAGSLFRIGDTWHVYRVNRGRAQLCTVVIGVTNGSETEILEGLAYDDQVILHPTERIVDGVKVKSSENRY